jgi:hypothetical protein
VNKFENEVGVKCILVGASWHFTRRDTLRKEMTKKSFINKKFHAKAQSDAKKGHSSASLYFFFAALRGAI